MPHREFTLEPSTADPPTFSIADREFKCLPEPPAGVLTDFLATAHGDVAVKLSGLVGFISGCLSDAEAEAFELLLHDKDTVVPLATLGDIAQWLAEVFTGRPTTPSSSSPAGSTPPVDSSGDGASSPETGPTPSDS